MGPNNSFKPNLLRYVNNMAKRACHVVASATQVGLTQVLGGAMANKQLEDITKLVEHYGACSALAAGGALIVAFADQLMLGPLVPQIVGSAITAIAGGLATYIGIDFVRYHQESGRIKLVLAMLLSAFLSLAGIYFVSAAVYAAKASAAA